MCGICGFIARNAPVEKSFLQRMNDTLRHRGPDGEGFFVQDNIGLAMRRLAIIDVAGGWQPIFNEDGSIAIVYNGEIYNFQEIRDELEKFGHTFNTSCDTEVVVHAYEQWGDDALLKFKGMFAFALWDAPRKRLLLARDRMGKKPLYWHYSANGLLFGSELKSLLVACWVKRRIHPQALHHYLTLQYTPDPLTILQDVHQLPAAHKLVLEQDCPPRVERWWQLEFEPKWNISEQEAVEQARKLLNAAVQRRLISEVPLGAFLSGGIDSSIVVALMAEHSREAVRTFSIGFTEAGYSETPYARLIAERYHTDHHEFIFRPDDLKRVIEGVVAAVAEPFADPAALPLYELARETRKYVTVALCGDGGDETVAGYRRYVLDGWLKLYTGMPTWFTQQVVPAVTALLPEPWWLPEDNNPITGLKRLGQYSRVTHKASLVRWGSYLSHEEKRALYSDEWRGELDSMSTAALIAKAYDDAHACSLLDRTLYADQVTYLAGDLLPKTDRMAMAHSVEARAPLLDAEWVEWTARLPANFKVRGKRTKWLLKRAFAAQLPDEIQVRGKQGFNVPIGLWLRDDLREWTRERLVENRALDAYFKPTAIRALFDEHTSGRVNHGKKLYALLMFALWQEQYLNV
ncbi:MAG TPA: asparagine synthase (glutamine-hydrolyzing) [Anaerolineae bacterium]|nr:asparagine synthase (glutamine-hydrolyzing) [Anaerolineae bacterium]